jgi:hypothetical protein
MQKEIMPLITETDWIIKMSTQADGKQGVLPYGQAMNLMKEWYAEYLKYAFPFQQSADLAVCATKEKEWHKLETDLRAIVKSYATALIDEQVKYEAERKRWREEEAEWLEKFAKDYYPIEIDTDWTHHIAALREGSKMIKPEIVCLCGSTRFVDTYNEWRKILTYQGKIVLSIEIVTSQSQKNDPQFVNSDLKKMLDELHLRKIDLADTVMFLNVNGYMGESTKRELEYAKQQNKKLIFLERSEVTNA